MAQNTTNTPAVPSRTAFFADPDPSDFSRDGLHKWRLTRTWLLFFENLVKLPWQNGYTPGNVVTLDTNGNLTDSGVAPPTSWGSGAWFSEIPRGLLNGTNKVFSLSYQCGLYPILVVNGVTKSPDTEFSISNGVLTYTTDAPDASKNEWHRIWYYRGARIPGQARLFNGSSDKLVWGANSAWNIGGDLSVAFWIKIPTGAVQSGGVGTLIFYGDASSGGNDSYKIFLAGGSNAWQITAGHEDVSSNQDSVTIASGLKNDTWYFIGIVRNATAKTYTGYVGDGSTLNAGKSGSYTHTPASPGGVQLTVGVQYNTGIGSPLYLNGDLEEHYIWSRQLSSAELTQAMRGAPSTTNLVLYCLMGNSPEQDLSATAGSGTVAGTTLVTGHS